jgi:hypothetical protein
VGWQHISYLKTPEIQLPDREKEPATPKADQHLATQLPTEEVDETMRGLHRPTHRVCTPPARHRSAKTLHQRLWSRSFMRMNRPT